MTEPTQDSPRVKPKNYIHPKLEIRLYVGDELVAAHVDPHLWGQVFMEFPSDPIPETTPVERNEGQG